MQPTWENRSVSSTAAAVCRTAAKQRWIPLCLAAWTKRASVRSRARRQKAGQRLCHCCILAPLCEDLKTRGGLSWGVLSTVVRNNDRWVHPRQARIVGG